MSGTPLPASLTGVTVQRLIEIDQALLYLVTGALDYAVIYEPLVETGALTAETVKDALSVMLETYLNQEVTMLPAGVMMMWFGGNAPDRWIFCDGSSALVTEYPELFALIGYDYGGDGDAFFCVPDMTNRSPYGSGVPHALGDKFGEETHVLTVTEMPSHTHPPLSPYVGFTGNRSGGVSAGVAGASLNNFATTGATGGGAAHNNIHPVMSVGFIIYGGKA